MTSLPTACFILALHVLLTLLPVVAGLLIATRFGMRDRLLLLSVGLCSLFVTGYLTFWIFWASATAGRIFTILLTPALVVLVVWLSVRLRRHLKPIGSDLLRPSLLWVASSLLIFSLGSMYASSRILTSTAESRFVAALPIDNEVPLILANALRGSAPAARSSPLWSMGFERSAAPTSRRLPLTRSPVARLGYTGHPLRGRRHLAPRTLDLWNMGPPCHRQSTCAPRRARIDGDRVFGFRPRQYLLHLAEALPGGLPRPARRSPPHSELPAIARLRARRGHGRRLGGRGAPRSRGQRPCASCVHHRHGDPTQEAVETVSYGCRCSPCRHPRVVDGLPAGNRPRLVTSSHVSRSPIR